MPNYQEEERSPFLSFIYLVFLALAGAVIFTAIAYAIGISIYGFQIITESQDILSGKGGEGIGFIKIVQIVSTIGTFIVPAFVFARLHSRFPLNYLKLDTHLKPVFILLGIAVMLASGPLLEWTIQLNKAMELPNFLIGLENWMKTQEYALEKLTIQLLQTHHFPDLLVNILMIAILPALGEELLFRGCLQKIITNKTNNYHAGIWLAAFVFSGIHMQFYGFMPRMLLGGLFGYLLVWSNSMWVPILAHFINNATTVIFAYIYERQGKSLEKIVNETSYDSNFVLYTFSFILTGLLLWVFYKKSLEFHKDAKGLG